MNRILMAIFMVPSMAVAQGPQGAVFNPDFDGDGCYASSDLMALLCQFGECGVEATDAAPGFQPYHQEDSCFSALDLVFFLALFGSCDAPEVPWSCGDSVVYANFNYATVDIGGQCWFADNLQSITYANGDPIDQVLDPISWASLSTGAAVIYGEGDGSCTELSPLDACDETIALEVFGRLYNGFAVSDPRGLCPVGWHVPSDANWTDLEDHLEGLGYGGLEGVALKADEGWYSAGDGEDVVGFSGVPGGYRFRNNGLFLDAGASSYMWSSTPSGNELWYRYLNNGNLGIVRSDSDLRSGFSVRCLKD